MFRRNFKLLLLGLFLVLVTLKAYAYDNHDFQAWNTETEEFKINKNLKASLEEEFRWGDNANQFYYQHYDAGLSYSLNKFWNVGGGYRHVLELKKGKWKVENEPYLVATLLWDLKGFKFEDRNRFEYRHFDYQTDAWRYRNKFTLRLPCKLTKLQIQPYISDEILVGFGVHNQLNQNRFSPGFSFNLTKNLKADIYYMLQSTRNGGVWTDINVLGTKFKLAF